MATQHVRTFCRICEPSCGLVAEVTDGRLAALRPDREHPVTKGFSCHKGIAAVDLHHDPDRLVRPLRRSGDGALAETGWDDAVAGVAAALRGVVDRHGPEALAMYSGNPLAFNALGTLATGALATGLGIRRLFSSGTQDCANKFVASEAVFGSRNVHPIPDLEQTDLCLIIGENPRASQASFWSMANVVGELRAARARGARLVFVNPRRIESPDRGLGDTVLIRPDTDVWFLASLLHELDRLGAWDEGVLRRHGRNVAELRAFVTRYPAAQTAAVTGIPAEVVTELAEAWRDTPRASVHASTGINMGRQGTLAYWLVHMLSFVTGRLDAEGGNLKSDGFYPNARSGTGVPEQSYVDSEFGRLRRGSLPGTLLSQYILDADRPVRGLVVMSGNPLLSIAGEERLRKAFEQLEVLVVVDLYRNATAEYAHWVLPATDMYERDDINIVNIGTSHQPFVQYTPAVVEPAGERRPEWWIVGRLLQAMGKPSVFDNDPVDPWAKWRHMLAKGCGVDLAELQTSDPVRVLPAPTPGRFYDEQVYTPDGRIDCCPPVFAEALTRCDALFADAAAADATAAGTPAAERPLTLIHKRDAWMHNSWMGNLERMKRAGRDTNPLFLHPDDAAARGLAAGDPVRVWNEFGEVVAPVSLDAELLPGVVAMVHGWGQAASPGLRVAQRTPGVNVNALLPIGDGSFEPLSSQAHMTGIPVHVAAATAPGGTR